VSDAPPLNAALLLNRREPKPEARVGTGQRVKLGMQKTGFISSLEYKRHQTGLGHPERASRIDSVLKAVEVAKLEARLEKIEPRRAGHEDLLRTHTAAYIATAEADVKSGARQLSTGDTAISEDSYDVALLSAGGILAAVDAVMAGKVRNAFCAVRPPGHHATPVRGMGFCLFNNIATGARYAQKKHGIGKILIADWDVHHGNGTQDVFYEDGSVLFFDTHQHPLYPGTGMADETGAGKGLGCIMNNPFPAGAGRAEVLGAFQNKLVKAVEKFKPEFVFISAGFDSRVGDPLGGFKLTDDDFVELTRVMKTIAKDHAGNRLVSVLEGGYSLEGLGKAAAAHVAALTE
jgi:acetoin utilization deacetylase AcuC-like enzyme